MKQEKLKNSLEAIIPHSRYLLEIEEVSLPRMLSMAAEKCFVEQIETIEARDIREALKELKEKGRINFD